MTALQVGGTVLSALTGLAAAGVKKRETKSQAAEARFAARDEYIKGREVQADLYRELASTVANQQVAFAAGGVALDSVSVDRARSMAAQDAENALGTAVRNAELGRLSRMRQASNLTRAAKNIGRGAVFGALGQAVDLGTSIAARG